MPPVVQVTHVRAVTTKLRLGSKPKSFLHVSLRCGAVRLPSNPITSQARRPLSAPSSHPFSPSSGRSGPLFSTSESSCGALPCTSPSPDPRRGGSFPRSPQKRGPSPVLPRSTCLLKTAGRRLQPCPRPAGSGARETARPRLEAQPPQPLPQGLGGSRAGEPPPAVSAQSSRPPEPWASPRSAAGSRLPRGPPTGAARRAPLRPPGAQRTRRSARLGAALVR